MFEEELEQQNKIFEDERKTLVDQIRATEAQNFTQLLGESLTRTNSISRSSFASKQRPVAQVVPSDDKVKELEEMCALNLQNFERQREQNQQLMRENKSLEIHILTISQNLKRVQTRSDSKDKLITELEDLVSQLTEEIEKDRHK